MAKGKNVLIVGFEQRDGGLQNALYYSSRGCNVRLTDLKDLESLGEGVEFLRSHGVEIISDGYREEDFKWADIVVKTPAIDLSNTYLKYAKKIVSSFSELLSSPLLDKTGIIIITGMKGKTIAASAVSHTLKTLGKTVHTCGNLGRSAFAELSLLERGDVPQYLICEFSSRQLRDAFMILGEDFPEVEITLVTGGSPENRGVIEGRELVFGEKSRKVVCPQALKKTLAEITGRKMATITSVESKISRMPLSIPPSLKNAYALLSTMGITASKINTGLKSFRGVPNQSEIILMNGELIAVNDSSATIPESVGFAYTQFSSFPIHLICGGTGKMLDVSSMLTSLKRSASITVLDGSFSRNVLIPVLEKNGIEYGGPFSSMKDAVEDSLRYNDFHDGKTDVILLSPGAMAYEFFSDEFDRGDQFSKAVKALEISAS
ncbi:MAG: hypothetical protein K5634_05720 [Sphaerochaetaceae bacterium]|nr:hypothetical protein [Sphaerochaetaceae bacterium]